MSEFFVIVFRAVFVENLALNFLLGMCTYLAVSQRVETAFGLGVAVTVVQTMTVPLNSFIYSSVLAPGAMQRFGFVDVDLSFLRLVVFIGVIAAFVQILELSLERYFPKLQQALGAYLPLLTVNCAILGGSLFMVQRDYTVVESVAYGFGSGAGWALAVILFATIRERLDEAAIPRGLRGLGIAFIVTGILALAFLGLRSIEI